MAPLNRLRWWNVCFGLCAVGFAASALVAVRTFAQAETPVSYRLATVDTGPIVSTVSASGTVNPVVTAVIGSQLSGQVQEILVDFNTPVRTGQVLARLNVDQIQARLGQAESDWQSASAVLLQQEAQSERMQAELDMAAANVISSRAEVARTEALAKDAERQFQRKRELSLKGTSSTAELERAQTAVETAHAQLASAGAQVQQATAAQAGAHAAMKIAAAQIIGARAQVRQREAAVRQIRVDLDNSEIRSPIDGVVIQRSVDVGQTVASSFQAPELFKIAQDLRRIEVWASVDEGDVGRVAPGQDVNFTVTAYPGVTFHGAVKQVRLGPQTIQNVVTYTVVIAADNPDLKLLPGMTATVRIVAARRDSALRVPNAALRYRPPGMSTRSDAVLGDNMGNGPSEAAARALSQALALSAEQDHQLAAILADFRHKIAELRQAGLPSPQFRDRVQSLRQSGGERIRSILTADQQVRYDELRAIEAAGRGAGESAGQIWVADAAGLRSVPVRLGISDGALTEITSKTLKPGDPVVIGTATASTPGQATALRF